MYITIVLCLLFSINNILASTEHHNIISNFWSLGAAYKETPAIGWLIFTFCLFIFILHRIINKKIKEFFKNRSDSIKLEIEESRILYEEAKEEIVAYENRQKNLDSEMDEIRRISFNKCSENKKAKIIMAKKLANNLKEESKVIFQSREEREGRLLKYEISELAIEMALKKIQTKKIDVDHESMYNELLMDINKHGGLNE